MRADHQGGGGAAAVAAQGPLRLAIVIHLFYEDQWPEFASVLATIGRDFTLFVSLTPESTLAADIHRAYPGAVVRRFANLGRDVAPFLAFLPELQDHDVVCKLHSKRSEGGHAGWRHAATRDLIGSAATVAAYLDAFARVPDLVLAGPREFYLDGRQHLFQSRRALELQYGEIPRIWGFFAGTMFWCRPQFFAGLAQAYPPEIFIAHGDDDGHPEHVIERAFGLMAAQQGKQVMLWDGAALIAPASRMRGNPDWEETYKRLERAAPDQSGVVLGQGRESLVTLHRAHAGLVSDKWSGNLVHYDRILRDLRDSDIRLLEIGVQNGGSLEIWSSYFARGRIFVGCDINPDCGLLGFADPRIHVVVADAGTPLAKTRIMELSGRFDLVIDDGSHRSGDILRAFLQYFPTVTANGLYVIEDLHCSYWREFEGGLDCATASLAFFRAVTDVINLEHWQDERNVAARFRHFEDAHGLEIDTRIFRSVASVEFVNSMVIIRKGGPEETQLGTRLVSGRIARVSTAVLAVDGTQSRVPGHSEAEDPTGAPQRNRIEAPPLSISTVIPFFNGSAFLPDAVASAASQSFRSREIIVVDDGSDPEEAAWLARFARDAGVKVITQRNMGQGGARNAGVAAARGSHICFLDQDDVFLPHHNEALVLHWRAESSLRERVGWVFGNLCEATEGLAVIRSGIFPYVVDPIPARIEDCLARDLTVFPSTTLIDRAAFLGVGGFDARLRGYEDDDLFLRLLLAGYRVGFCPGDVALWRRHDAQTSRSMAFIRSAEVFFDKWIDHPWPEQQVRAFARSNLRARMLRSLQHHLRQDSAYDAEALWDFYRRIEREA